MSKKFGKLSNDGKRSRVHVLTCIDMSKPVFNQGLREGLNAVLLHSFQRSVPKCVRPKATDQRFNVRFYLKLDKMAMEIRKMLAQVYGQEYCEQKMCVCV